MTFWNVFCKSEEKMAETGPCQYSPQDVSQTSGHLCMIAFSDRRRTRRSNISDINAGPNCCRPGLREAPHQSSDSFHVAEDTLQEKLFAVKPKPDVESSGFKMCFIELSVIYLVATLILSMFCADPSLHPSYWLHFQLSVSLKPQALQSTQRFKQYQTCLENWD